MFVLHLISGMMRWTLDLYRLPTRQEILKFSSKFVSSLFRVGLIYIFLFYSWFTLSSSRTWELLHWHQSYKLLLFTSVWYIIEMVGTWLSRLYLYRHTWAHYRTRTLQWHTTCPLTLKLSSKMSLFLCLCIQK